MEQPRCRVLRGAQRLRVFVALLVALLGDTGALATPFHEASANPGSTGTTALLSRLQLPPDLPPVDDFAPEPPPAGEPSPLTVRYQYQRRWEYRWGDSPVAPAARLSWAQPDSTDAGWIALPHFHNLPDRQGRNFLWMRTRLHGPPLSDPILYLFVVDQIFEAYLDGRLIYRFGEFSGPRQLQFSGYKAHILRIGSGYAGKMLTLRIYSNHTNIGVSGVPRIGEYGDIVVELFKEDLSRLLIGAVLFLIGVLVLVFSALARRDRAYLMYGAFALSAGTYFLMQLQVRALLLDRPLLWIHIEIASLYCLSFFLCGYIEQVFGRGPLGLVRRLFQLHGVCIACAAALVGSGRVALLQTLPLFQLLIFVDALVLPATVLRAARIGNPEARIFLAGFAPAAAISIYDIFAASGLLPRTQLTMSHIGNAAFVLALGAILSRRFVLLQRRLRDYSAVLQLSLASTQALAPEQRSQVALDELLRLLGAMRALLFLLQEEPKSLVFSLGRDREGNRIDNPQGTSYSLIRRAVARRHPVILKPDQNLTEAVGPGAIMEPSAVTPGPPIGRHGISVMAAPLLARDQLLGVVYLESDADRRGFHEDDMAILAGLASHLAIAIVSSRAVRLEVEATINRQRFDEKSTLLDAALRMAAGDLSTPISAPPGSAATHLAQALDAMRRDIFSKVQMLQTRSAEIQSLNEELRRQIEQRSRRLMSVILRQQGGRAAPLKPLEVGQVLVGRYRVIRTLGQGAMGVVYEVERTTDRTRLAAKLLSTRADQTAVVRFTREAQILARLSHPNLIAIRDVDITAGGVLFIVLELVVGSSLNGLRSRYGDFPWSLTVLRQIADGLAAIHEAGVVHRDLKPANVLIAQDDVSGAPLVKLADFGVSLLLSDSNNPLSAHSGRFVARLPEPSAMAAREGEDSGDAVAASLPSHDEGQATPLEDDADVPAATVSLSPEAPSPAAAYPSPPPVAGALPAVIRAAAADEETVHPGAAASPAHTAALLSASAEDVGLAESGRLTVDGMLVGTPMYMAPELWNLGSQQAGPASDIFSFGVIACELLTGALPFKSAPVLARWQGESVTIAKVRQLRPDVPRELADLVDDCLTEEPSQRPVARALVTRLSDLAAALKQPFTSD